MISRSHGLCLESISYKSMLLWYREMCRESLVVSVKLRKSSKSACRGPRETRCSAPMTPMPRQVVIHDSATHLVNFGHYPTVFFLLNHDIVASEAVSREHRGFRKITETTKISLPGARETRCSAHTQASCHTRFTHTTHVPLDNIQCILVEVGGSWCVAAVGRREK